MDYQDRFVDEVFEHLYDDSEQNFFPLNMTKNKNDKRNQEYSDESNEQNISTHIQHQCVEPKKEKDVDEYNNFTCSPLDVEDQSYLQEPWHEESSVQFIQTPEKQPLAQSSKKISKIYREPVYMLPGESKNIPKNFVRSLKSFTVKNFSEICQNDQDVKKFLSLKPEKACKQSLEKALKSSIMKQIGRLFFGQKRWSYEFLQENKVDLEPYFRFNSLWI